MIFLSNRSRDIGTTQFVMDNDDEREAATIGQNGVEKDSPVIWKGHRGVAGLSSPPFFSEPTS